MHQGFNYKFLLGLVKSQPIYFLVTLIVSLTSTWLNILGTICLIPILEIWLGDGSHLVFPRFFWFYNYLIQRWQNVALERQLFWLIALLALIVLCKNIAIYISTILGFKYTKQLVFRMKQQGLEVLSQVSPNYYREHKLGDILIKLNRETEKTVIAVKSIQKMLVIGITFILLTAALISISPALAIVSLVTISCVIKVNSWLVTLVKKGKVASGAQTQSLNRKLIEFFTGIRLIKSLANENAARDEILQLLKSRDREQMQTQIISAALNPCLEMGWLLIVLTVVLFGIYWYDQPLAAIASEILIFLIILFRLLPFVSQFNTARLQFLNTRGSVATVANFLSGENKQFEASGKMVFSNLTKGIALQEVTFAYPRQAEIILDKVNLWIPQGKTTALMGFSGSGKSTITDLLVGLYRPIEGKIVIDDHDYLSYDLASLRQVIAVVERHTFLFNNSLAYNIAYGVADAQEEEIILAAQRAQLYKELKQFPGGLATHIGEAGRLLSEGQKQKIGLARAFLRNPQILILDEPIEIFSGRPETLAEIPEILADLCRDRTTLIVTKQLNLAQKADQIVLMNRGRIVETGTHETLVRQSGIYQRLYSQQFKTNQQSRQQMLAQKIAQKLAQQSQGNLSLEIRSNLNALLNQLDLISEGLLANEQEQNHILDESYQTAKNTLLSLREYERKVAQDLDKPEPKS